MWVLSPKSSSIDYLGRILCLLVAANSVGLYSNYKFSGVLAGFRMNFFCMCVHWLNLLQYRFHPTKWCADDMPFCPSCVYPFRLYVIEEQRVNNGRKFIIRRIIINCSIDLGQAGNPTARLAKTADCLHDIYVGRICLTGLTCAKGLLVCLTRHRSVVTRPYRPEVDRVDLSINRSSVI